MSLLATPVMGQSEIQSTKQPAAPPTIGPSSASTPARVFVKSTELKSNNVAARTKDIVPATIATSQSQFPARLTAIQNQKTQAEQACTNLFIRKSARLSDGSWVSSPILATGGGPLLVKSANRRSTQLIKTSQVWPAAQGGTVLPGLSGIGRPLLMWDGGSDGIPYQQHPEFLSAGVSRIFSVIPNTAAEFHSSAVAGTLGAAGLNPDARGMAFNSNILAEPQTQDLTQLTGQTLAELATRRVSNHSYGFDHGWTYTVTRLITGGNTQTFKPWRLDPANPAVPAIRAYADNLMNFRDNIEIVETTSNATLNQVHRIRLKQKSPTTSLRQVDPATGNLVTGGQWVSLTLTGVQASSIDFVITAFTLNFGGGNVVANLTWNAVIGQTYRIQTSTNLSTWTDNSGDILPLGEVVTVSGFPTVAGGSRFYRIAAVAPNPFALP